MADRPRLRKILGAPMLLLRKLSSGLKRAWQALRLRLSRRGPGVPASSTSGRSRLGAILGTPANLLRRLGRGFRRGWAAIRARLPRRRRSRRASIGLTIRKASLRRKYSVDQDPARLFGADVANTLAVGIGVAIVPLLWDRLGFYWLVSLVAGALPLIVAYWRLRRATASSGGYTWDVLTVACLLIGAVVTLSALSALILDFTTERDGAELWPTLTFGYLALPVWIVAEATNAYARLIRRPRPWEAVLSLLKSLLFAAGASFMLLYLVLVVNVQCLGPICIEPISAAALFWIAAVALVVALLLQLVPLLAVRLSRRAANTRPATSS